MSKPIRILHVLGRLDMGGAEILIMNWYRNIDRSKIQFDFIIHTEEKCFFEEEIRLLGGKIFRVPRYIGINHFEYKKSWEDFFEKNNSYKIVHGHMRSTASIYLKIAKRYRVATIIHSHSTSSGSGISSIAKNILQFPVRYVADYLFACSKNAGEWLYGKRMCKKEKFHIIKNAINIEKFMFNNEIRLNKRTELKLEDKFVVGHIGRFDYPKNHVFLIEIFNEIYKLNNKSVLLVVGDGELRSKIEDKLNKLGLSDNAIFTGNQLDVSDLLQAMDVFVFPSLYEGLGIVTIEAQAAGLPCIVSAAVPKEETKITDLIKYISLKCDASNWAKEVTNFNKISNRENMHKKIVEAGYELKSACDEMQEKYSIIYNESR
ncbi:MAG: glycosyltransferase family 1 protein [Proteocatella sp.]